MADLPADQSDSTKPESGKETSASGQGDAAASTRKLTARSILPKVQSALPLVALALSLTSLATSISTSREVALIGAIKSEYDLYHSMADKQLQYPLTTHLFSESRGAYDRQSKMVQAVAAKLTERELSESLLRERAMAHAIFTSFEETFFLHMQAEASHRARAKFLEDNLEFFSRLLCENPRLSWYWDKKGGQFESLFAPRLADYLEQNGLKDCPSYQDWVADGPFQRASYDRPDPAKARTVRTSK